MLQFNEKTVDPCLPSAIIKNKRGGEDMDYKINVGDAVPQFKVKDYEGFDITDEDLIGNPLVIYFYPKDDTPGCTKEACSFRDNFQKLFDLNTLVLGVSPDNIDSHRRFIDKHKLNFTLLSDEKLEMCKKFDVVREKHSPDGKTTQAIERTTFVIDPDGIVAWIERPVNVEGHTERVLEAVKNLYGQKSRS